jgi:rhodanese-related sulfurtransferase
MNRRILVRLLLALALLLVGADRIAGQAKPGKAVAVEGGEYREVTIAELQTMMEQKDFPLINVHVPFEGDLPKTDESIPFDHIVEHLDQLPADKNARIVLYCRSGSMSNQAATELVKLGYKNVYHLGGGFRAWRAAGLPMVGGG